MARERTQCRKVAALAVLAVFSAGCAANHYSNLNSENEIPELAALGPARRGLTITETRTSTKRVDGRQAPLASEELGSGPRERLVVMLHGLLSDRSVWRFVSADLASDHRMLLIDLLGCGDSDRPDPDSLPTDGYSPTSQARHVLMTLQHHLRYNDRLEHITLVGHSYGGAVALRVLGAQEFAGEFGEVLRRIDGVVLLAPMGFSVDEPATKRYRKILKLKGTKIRVAAATRQLKNQIARVAATGTYTPGRLPREDVDQVLAVFKERDRRRAMHAMIRQAIPHQPRTLRPDWREIKQLVGDYQNIQVPTLIIWGERDKTLPVSKGYQLRALLPEAWLRVIDESMHCLPLERPMVVADLTRSFLVAQPRRRWPAIAALDPDLIVMRANSLPETPLVRDWPLKARLVFAFDHQ